MRTELAPVPRALLSPVPQMPVPMLIRELEERLPVLRMGVQAGGMDGLVEQCIARLHELEALKS